LSGFFFGAALHWMRECMQCMEIFMDMGT
jgi:hypothetical protein